MNIRALSAENKKYRHLLAALLLAVAVLVMYWKDVRYFFTVPKPLAHIYQDDFRDAGPRLRAEAREIRGDWILQRNALMLKPGGAGEITFVIKNSPQSSPYVRLWMAESPNVRVRLTVRSNSEERVYDHRFFDGRKILLHAVTHGHASFALTFKARAASIAAAAPVPVLTRIEIYSFRDEADRIVPFPALAALLVIPFLIYFLLSVLGAETLMSCVTSAFVFAVLLLFGRVSPYVLRFATHIAYAFVLLCWAATWLRKQYSGRRVQLLTLTALVVALYGFSLRWQPLIERLGAILDPDAEDFYQIATTARGVFNSSFAAPPYIREPLFPWLIKVFFLIVPATRDSLRLLTVLLSTGAVFLSFMFARSLFSPRGDDNNSPDAARRLIRDLAAPGVALFMAANPFLIFMSNRGLRFELWMILVLLFLMSLKAWEKRRALGSARLGVVAGANHLLRITTIYYTMPLMLIFGLWKKAKWHYVVMAAAISVALLAPHLIFNYLNSDSHDAFYTSNVHARYYRNKEFAGTPGFPSVEEIRLNAWAGKPVTTFEYVFGLHAVGNVAMTSLRGLVRIFATAYPRDDLFAKSLPLYLVYLVGLVILPLTRQRWLIIVLLFLELPAYFLAGKSLDPRLVLYIAPLQGCILALGFLALINGIILIMKILGVLRGGGDSLK